MKEILDVLIAERAPWLYRDRLGTQTIRSGIHRILGYEKTLLLAEAFRDMPADQIMSVMSATVAKKVAASGISNLPTDGPALVVANHPTGIADGIVLHKIISERRPDVYYFANHDILRILPQMTDVIAPVEWRKEKRSHGKTRETMSYTRRAIEQGRIGVIFPSGRLAKRRGLHLHERPWMASAAMIARKFDLPIIPIRISARNSALFYAFDALHPTLRDITLFHETLNKGRQTFDVTIGEPISAQDLPHGSDAAIDVLKSRVLTLQDKPAALPMLGGSGRKTTSLKQAVRRSLPIRV